MPAEPAYVIVGASLAGAKAAETLREEGFTGAIVLIGAEDLRPYERPPLSKGYLLGKDDADSVFVHEPGWYAEHDVDLRLGVTVTAVDTAARQVEVDGGDPVAFDKLLITTGASPRRLRAPGTDLDGVLYLRTRPDSDRLRASLAAAAGWSSPDRAGSGWRPPPRPGSMAATSRSWSPSPVPCTARSALRSVRSSLTCTAATEWSSGSARASARCADPADGSAR